MKTIFKLLIISTIVSSCQKTQEQQTTDSLKTAIETPKKTPQELMQEIDSQLFLGDSLLHESENEESLEGSMEYAYYDENYQLTKIKRENFGETYMNVDQFYFDSTANLIAVKSEKFTYNRSTTEESETPLISTPQGKHIVCFEGNKIVFYQKLKSKRKFEDKTEAQEADYWQKQARASAKQFEQNKESDFYEKFTQLQYDETKNSPIHIYKLRDKMYCLNNFDDEVFKSTRFEKIKTPNLGVIELTYKPETSGWHETKTSTLLQSSGEIKVDKKSEVVEIDHQKYLFIRFQLFEGNSISKYFTLINLTNLSSTSLIASNGKSNKATITNKAIRDFLISRK